MNAPLVSIIIPTYNRAHLIGETLDSVIAQTYQNWECIVVDDGSTDHTEEVMAEYMAKDSRIRFYHRPPVHKPGGNGARNYGFKLSKGEYVQWFDSDDLMHKEKLWIKINRLINENTDFVISQTEYFNKINKKTLYNYKKEEINFISFTTTHVSWYTPDMMILSKIARYIEFNEELRSGQEYNFICKLLIQTNKVSKINQVLTHRRYHEESIGAKRRVDKQQYLKTRFEVYWLNLQEVSELIESPEFEKHQLLVCVSAYLQKGANFGIEKRFRTFLTKVFKGKAIYFYLAVVTERLFGRHHYFYSKLKKN